MEGNPFRSRYAKLSDLELLEILAKVSDFQPLAVETAKIELTSRNLSSDEISRLNEVLALKKQIEISKQAHEKEQIAKIKAPLLAIARDLNPFLKEKPDYDKYIFFISLFSAFIFLTAVSDQFSLILYIFFHSKKRIGFGDIVIFIPIFILFSGTIFFWFRKKTGWLLLCIFFYFTLSEVLESLISSFYWKPVGISAFDFLLRPKPITYFLWTVIYSAASLWALHKKGMREIYKIKSADIFVVIGIAFSAFLFIFAYFHPHLFD